MKIIITICALCLFTQGCGQEKKNQVNVITIVNIGNNDRIELGKQLRIILDNSPKLVGLDFFLVPDSLGKDSILVKELSRATNTVQVVALHDFDSVTKTWKYLEVSHSKFKATAYGYSNIATTDDSVLVRGLPLKQSYKNSFIPSFSYAIAQKYSGVKDKYRNTDTKGISFPFLQFERGYSVITKEDLMKGNFDKSNIEGKIVLMGYIGYGDDYYLDHGRHWKVNGVAIHAAIINEIIDR
ncbi:MAG: CHASE2 domain-containing protein [Bacteroidetes bacterium]|nr:CHASE2 domain-containing protein [Bacteroidota bacterium]